MTKVGPTAVVESDIAKQVKLSTGSNMLINRVISACLYPYLNFCYKMVFLKVVALMVRKKLVQFTIHFSQFSP